MKPSRSIEEPSASIHSKVDSGTPGGPVGDRHIRMGWWFLAIYLAMGLMLEGFHGFKVGLYLDVSNETRRMMWTLAHAHGTLLGMINLAFAMYLALYSPGSRRLGLASPCLIGATVIMPAGFFLGGLFIHGADPGLGIVLVPIGGIMLLIAIILIAMSGTRMKTKPLGSDSSGGRSGPASRGRR
jgi:hypothetical protein